MRKLSVEIICALFVLLWLYAAISKVTDFDKFRIQLGQSPLLTAFASWVAWIIPSLEISIGLLLVIPKTRLLALYASFSLMVMFTAYIVAITQFSEYIPCSCGGILQHMSWNTHLFFNLFFVGLALIGILLISGTKNPKTTFKEIKL